MYIPQIVAITKNRNDSASVSPITFGGWSIGCVITILYAWFFVGDKIFTAVSAGNLIGSGTVFLLVAKKIPQQKQGKHPSLKLLQLKFLSILSII